MNDDIVIGDFTEGTPASRPEGATDEAIWRRIERYIVWRWGERSVSWTVRGGGFFMPPLKPVTFTTLERFNDWGAQGHEPGDWITWNLRSAPFGVELDTGYYRITGTAGADSEPPADVLEAYSRLAEYLADAKTGGAGVTSITESLPGVTRSVRRHAEVMGRALEYSGAADLLKAYRYV